MSGKGYLIRNTRAIFYWKFLKAVVKTATLQLWCKKTENYIGKK